MRSDMLFRIHAGHMDIKKCKKKKKERKKEKEKKLEMYSSVQGPYLSKNLSFLN